MVRNLSCMGEPGLSIRGRGGGGKVRFKVKSVQKSSRDVLRGPWIYGF